MWSNLQFTTGLNYDDDVKDDKDDDEDSLLLGGGEKENVNYKFVVVLRYLPGTWYRRMIIDEQLDGILIEILVYVIKTPPKPGIPWAFIGKDSGRLM